MVTARRSKRFTQSPTELWKRMGGWGTIHDWHPAVASTEVSADGSLRTLTLADGATLVERLMGQDEHSYSYAFVEAPLPVKDYRATIRVRPDEAGSMVEWEGTFSAAGISDPEAVALIEGIYQAGLDAL
ncbi:MAG: SRPBCC family protein [Euryarchaeota archaeon]|nr:SRPBCC family protein [Euryarchaeota archaeon]